MKPAPATNMRLVRNTAKTLALAASVTLWTCITVRFLKSCATSAATERRRVEEAKMLVELVCSRVEGATLAHEFARCEEASTLVKSSAVSVLRIADRALGNMVAEVLDMAKQGALASTQLAVAAVFLLHAPSALIALFSQTDEREMYSPMAVRRMASAVLVGDPFEKKMA